jgi:hypothetical protein
LLFSPELCTITTTRSTLAVACHPHQARQHTRRSRSDRDPETAEGFRLLAGTPALESRITRRVDIISGVASRCAGHRCAARFFGDRADRRLACGSRAGADRRRAARDADARAYGGLLGWAQRPGEARRRACDDVRSRAARSPAIRSRRSRPWACRFWATSRAPSPSRKRRSSESRLFRTHRDRRRRPPIVRSRPTFLLR